MGHSRWQAKIINLVFAARGPVYHIIYILGNIVGFGVGVGAGLAAGAYAVSKFKNLEVEAPQIERIAEEDDGDRIEELLKQVPEWVKSPSSERVGWMNAAIAKAWPHLNAVACSQFENGVWPAAKEKLVERGIGVQLRSVTMGTIPFTFDYVGAVQALEDQCMVESTIKLAGNSSILMDMRYRGLQMTAQMREIQIIARVRLKFAPLTADFPCFAGVHLSLLDEPDIDFAFHVEGNDVMVVPHVRSMLHGLAHGILANLLLWPKSWLWALQHEALAACNERARGTLSVKVIRATSLWYSGLGLPAPYVKLRLDGGGRSVRTAHREATSSPEWGQEVLLPVDDAGAQALQLQVLDFHAIFRADDLGSASVALRDLVPDEPKSCKLQLQLPWRRFQISRQSGTLEVELLYRVLRRGGPQDDDPRGKKFARNSTLPLAPASGAAGLLEVHLHEGVDLEPLNNGHINCYCKLFVGNEVKKSQVVSHLTNPRWDEEFEFLMAAPPVDTKLRIEVWHMEEVNSIFRNSVSGRAKTMLGILDVSLRDVVDNRRLIDRYQLGKSKQGRLKVEMIWRSH
eukprot:jgi/Mesen1/5940/ME000301S05055